MNNIATDVKRAPVGQIVVVYDTAAGLMRLHSRGFLEPRQIDQCFRDAASIVAMIRSRRKPVRAVVDAREAVIQSAESAERIRVGTKALYAPCDRVAMLVSNSLVKMQMRRVVDAATHHLFISENAALVWLRGQDER